MLMNHSDSSSDRVSWRVELSASTKHFDPTLIRSVQTGEDVGKSCFAGSVFTEKRVNLAYPNIEGDVLIGDHAGEFLRYVKSSHRRSGGCFHECVLCHSWDTIPISPSGCR